MIRTKYGGSLLMKGLLIFGMPFYSPITMGKTADPPLSFIATTYSVGANPAGRVVDAFNEDGAPHITATSDASAPVLAGKSDSATSSHQPFAGNAQPQPSPVIGNGSAGNAQPQPSPAIGNSSAGNAQPQPSPVGRSDAENAQPQPSPVGSGTKFPGQYVYHKPGNFRVMLKIRSSNGLHLTATQAMVMPSR